MGATGVTSTGMQNQPQTSLNPEIPQKHPKDTCTTSKPPGKSDCVTMNSNILILAVQFCVGEKKLAEKWVSVVPQVPVS